MRQMHDPRFALPEEQILAGTRFASGWEKLTKRGPRAKGGLFIPGFNQHTISFNSQHVSFFPQFTR